MSKFYLAAIMATGNGRIFPFTKNRLSEKMRQIGSRRDCEWDCGIGMYRSPIWSAASLPVFLRVVEDGVHALYLENYEEEIFYVEDIGEDRFVVHTFGGQISEEEAAAAGRILFSERKRFAGFRKGARSENFDDFKLPEKIRRVVDSVSSDKVQFFDFLWKTGVGYMEVPPGMEGEPSLDIPGAIEMEDEFIPF